MILITHKREENGVIEFLKINGFDTPQSRQWVVDQLIQGISVFTFPEGNIGDEVIIYRDRFITTRGNKSEKDNLDNLPSF